LLALLPITLGCSITQAKISRDSNAKFDDFKNRLIEVFGELHPKWAVQMCYQKCDRVINIPNDVGRDVKKAFVKSYTGSLTQFKTENLSSAKQCDFFIIMDQLESMKWYQEV
jgi:hypothetical protein